MTRPRPLRRWAPLLLLLALNLAIVGLGLLFRQTVVPGWKKGPLIDPAAPYSPENAQVLFSVAACVALDAYVLLLALWRRSRRPAAWVPWVALLAAALLSEGVIRAWLAVDMVTYFRPHPVLHWVVRSDLRGFDNLTGGGRITTNHDGKRMPGPDRVRERGPVEEEVFRIVVTGDSSNFGHGVEGEQMWSTVLEELLDPLTPRRVEVINASCPGWTTYQAVQDLDLSVRDYHPDLLIAGFNNDPGPDYLHDADRVLPPGPRRTLAALAWRSEVFLLSREVFLSMLRRVSPAARATYTERRAGEDPKYGQLSPEEEAALVPRVPLEAFLANLVALDEAGRADGFRFVWVDMPINRGLPQLVGRYVDPAYRQAARELVRQRDIPWVGVDGRWVETGAQGLHIEGHVFHPNAEGHRRLARQVAEELLARGLVPGASAGGLPAEGATGRAPHPATSPAQAAGSDLPPGAAGSDLPPGAAGDGALRLGWSSRTPVHAHVGAVLEAMPELAAAHGLRLDLSAYAGGKEQGEQVAGGALDAFFSCEVPAVHMVQQQPDARIVGSPGGLGRIAVVAQRARAPRLEALRGARVGLSPGSTPAMDWETWGAGLGATVVPLSTEELGPALEQGRVDAVVGWDPWVEQWLQADPDGRVVLAERPFRSVLAIRRGWALGGAGEAGGARAARLAALVEAALRVAASDRPRWDAAVAARGGWSVEVVRAVGDRNELLAGRATSVPWAEGDALALDRAGAWVGREQGLSRRLVDLSLLQAPPGGAGPPGAGISSGGPPAAGPR